MGHGLVRVRCGRFRRGIELRHVGDELDWQRLEMHIAVRAACMLFAVDTVCARTVREKSTASMDKAEARSRCGLDASVYAKESSVLLVMSSVTLASVSA